MVTLGPGSEVLHCSLILAENLDNMDKEELLQRLADQMEVRQVTFLRMVELVEACKKEGAREGEVAQQDQEDQTKDFWTVTNGIMPGTLWCGVDDIAETYKDLGVHWQVCLHLEPVCTL